MVGLNSDSEGKEGQRGPQTPGVGQVQHRDPRRAGLLSHHLAVVLATPVLWLHDRHWWVLTAQPAHVGPWCLVFPIRTEAEGQG